MFLNGTMALALLILLVSCGQPPAPEAPATPAPASAAASAAPEEDLSPLLAELTQTLRKFSAEQRRVPTSLNELVTAGYLPATPKAPTGKAFVIDAREVKVVLK